jgi:hypothetical protein
VVKSKNKLAECSAKDAYNGRSFLLKRTYAELSGHSWFILSAKYGLLRPDSTIDPNYDVTLSTKRETNRLISTIKDQLIDFLEFSIVDDLFFLGPERYAKALGSGLNGKHHITLIHVTKGLSQGRTQKKVKELIDQLSVNA